jgi:hypothetical protein
MPTKTLIPAGVTGEDLYRPGTLLDVMEQVGTAPSYIRDNLFPGEDITEADFVMVDYWKGGNLLAPFVSYYAKGSVVKRAKIKTNTFKPPKLAPILPLTVDDLFNRQPGKVDITKEADLLAADLEDLDRRLGRSEEWMCAQCIHTGQVPITDFDSGKLIATLDYGPIVPTVPAVPWTDSVASKPLDDLKACIRAVGANANLIADIIAFGSNAATLFENADQVQNAYNKLFIQQGLITPKMVEWGVTTLGTFRGIPLVIYEASYVDSAGNSQFYLDSDSVLVACSANKGRMAYAGVGQKNERETDLTVYASKRLPLVWFPEDSD